MSTYIDERNPFLPEAPADGQHIFSDQPADIGGNHRCKLCGAYAGSDEGKAVCLGSIEEEVALRHDIARRDWTWEDKVRWWLVEKALGLLERVDHLWPR